MCSWSMSLTSRADTKPRAGERTGSMCYPHLPVYVACPIDGEGYSHSLHQNFLFPISHNLEQDECDISVEGDGSNKPTPVPHAEDTLLVDWLTKC